MIYRLVGYARKTGEFNGTAYDNVNLSVVRPAAVGSNESGMICEVLKVKYANFAQMHLVVDTDIDVEFNRYGQIQSVVPCK